MRCDTKLSEQYRDGTNLEARIHLHEQYSLNPRGLHPWLLAQIDVPAQANVLELGCGVGSFWTSNRDHIPSGWRVTLTDVSPGMVREAERGLRNHPLTFTYATVDAADLPYADATFDAVFAHFMLYHVDDRPGALREIARVLRSGGQLYAATNGARHMYEARFLTMRAGVMTVEEVGAGDAVAFSLENGAGQLQWHFPEVALRRYPDSLVVTEAEPLLAYVLSSPQVQRALAGLDAAGRERSVTKLRRLIDEQLTAEGQIDVTKDSGLFIARRL